MTDHIDDLKEAERVAQQPSQPRERNWLWGAVLVLVGIGLLVSNFTNFRLDNWWALIVVALGGRGLWNSWSLRQKAGVWTSRAKSGLIWGAIITLAGVIFLFNWSWSNLWPLVIIIIGVGTLLPTGSDR